jgi:hypothetical protein
VFRRWPTLVRAAAICHNRCNDDARVAGREDRMLRVLMAVALSVMIWPAPTDRAFAVT